jgi:hypothetical protein
MPRQCTICAHKQRIEINRELIDNQAFRHIASRYNVSTTSLQRHKNNHLPKLLMKAKQMKEITHANYLANEIESLKKRAKKIASKAEKDGDYRTALQGVRELTRIVELLAKMRGELYEQSVNVIINNQWVEIRTKILSALEDYPDAKIELSRVLDDVK